MAGARAWRRRLLHLVAVTATALCLLTLAPAGLSSTAAATCSNAKTYAGLTYCPASVKDVRNATRPTGSRVWLAVTVETVTTTTVKVAQWEWPVCPPGQYCGAGATLQEMTVPWSGTKRPAYGDVVTLFGEVSTSATTRPLKPAGYVKTGYCPIDWC